MEVVCNEPEDVIVVAVEVVPCVIEKSTLHRSLCQYTTPLDKMTATVDVVAVVCLTVVEDVVSQVSQVVEVACDKQEDNRLK